MSTIRCQAAVVPAPFIRRALAEIEVTYHAIMVKSPPQPLSELATTIVKKYSTTI